jgi:uncharacterized membrane protein YjgN (DUF898 family)
VVCELVNKLVVIAVVVIYSLLLYCQCQIVLCVVCLFVFVFFICFSAQRAHFHARECFSLRNVVYDQVSRLRQRRRFCAGPLLDGGGRREHGRDSVRTDKTKQNVEVIHLSKETKTHHVLNCWI